MDTKTDIHLTDMSQALSQDFSGAYRRELLDQVKAYQREIPGGTSPHIQQALKHAETILTTE
ncbi:MAG: hypothetical protein ACSW8C_01145 [bacterium]